MKTEDLRKLIEVEHVCRFWGDDYNITPRLVDKILGDGKQLIQLEPLNTRPDYYVVRIDSRWNLDDDDVDDADADANFIIHHLGEIYNAIDEQFGAKCECEDPDDCECDEGQGFPVLSTDCGVSWGDMDWPQAYTEDQSE